VDELVSTVLVAYGTESDGRTAETRVSAALR
jgi:hypothetical protein